MEEQLVSCQDKYLPCHHNGQIKNWVLSTLFFISILFVVMVVWLIYASGQAVAAANEIKTLFEVQQVHSQDIEKQFLGAVKDLQV
jgi:hypothetical protein